MFHKILSLIIGDDRQAESLRIPKNHTTSKVNERDLLRQESKIGANLFGPIPKGHRRDFFCLDEATWIWHEEWKDEKGVTHYGDSVPAQYSNRDNSVMSRQGITIQRNKAVSYQDLAVEQAKQEQDKKDKALLSAFTNENEIDLARDRNLQLDQVTIEGLQLQKINSQKRLTVSQKYADGFVKRKKTIPTDLTADIKANQAEIAQQNQQIASRKASMTETRQRFDDDKKRYIALKNRSVDSSISSSQTPPPTKP